MSGIKAILDTSFLDWRGRVCAVVFMGGCNFRCPFCHNHSLVLTPDEYETISSTEVVRQLAPFRKWLGGICITGGEPTLDPALPENIRSFKDNGWAVKLDTNGSRPGVLSELLAEGLLDAVAMDVKAPLDPDKYARCAGVPVDLNRIRESIRLLGESGIEHEFRMTVVPGYHNEDDVGMWAAALSTGSARLTLQNFNPRTTMAPELGQEQGFAPEVFENLRTLVARTGKNVRRT